MKGTLLLTVAIAWMGIGNGWSESVIAQEEAAPVGATEGDGEAARKTNRLQKELDEKDVEVANLRERLKELETMLKAQSAADAERKALARIPSAPTSPQELAIDQVIDRAAALRKQAIRAKLRGYEDKARRLWLQAEDVSKEIEQHLRGRHPGVQPLGLGSPPRQPPAPDAVPRKLRRVTPTEARPGVRSAAPGSKPRKLRRVTPKAGSPEPRVRSARPEKSRTRASGKQIREEIEHLRGEVRELRELLKKALSERKTSERYPSRSITASAICVVVNSPPRSGV